jgi:hypothetical protein
LDFKMALNKLEKILIGGMISGAITTSIGFISKCEIGSYIEVGGMLIIGICGGILTSKKIRSPYDNPYSKNKEN